jgi:hypothetical protein
LFPLTFTDTVAVKTIIGTDVLKIDGSEGMAGLRLHMITITEAKKRRIVCLIM